MSTENTPIFIVNNTGADISCVRDAIIKAALTHEVSEDIEDLFVIRHLDPASFGNFEAAVAVDFAD